MNDICLQLFDSRHQLNTSRDRVMQGPFAELKLRFTQFQDAISLQNKRSQACRALFIGANKVIVDVRALDRIECCILCFRFFCIKATLLGPNRYLIRICASFVCICTGIDLALDVMALA
ncbi:hypothetical protein Droror1_Dr00009901 [Drosera rotundifolia]